MMLLESTSGFPLGAWLRHGTADAGLGTVDMIEQIVERVRQHWTHIMILFAMMQE